MAKTPKIDRVHLGPYVGSNTRVAVRDCGDSSHLAFVSPAPDGTPIPDHADLIRLGEPDSESGGWQDVTTLYGSGDRRATTGGPAQVATDAYRDGHDRIFGKKPTVGLA